MDATLPVGTLYRQHHGWQEHGMSDQTGIPADHKHGRNSPPTAPAQCQQHHQVRGAEEPEAVGEPRMALQALQGVEVVAFDKTGTLTEGRP